MKDIRTLKTMICQLMTILNRRQRFQFIGMMIVILIGSVFELLGVSVMLPFIQALLDPNELMSKPYISFFSNLLGLSDGHSLVIMVGIGIVVIYLIKNTYLAFSSYLQVSYSNNTKRQLSVLVLESFVDRPYSFFVENGSGAILRGVNNDVMGVYHVLSNLFKIAAEGFVVVAVAIYLCLVDPMLAVGIVVVSLACMLAIIFGIKRILTKLSHLYRAAAAELNKQIVQISGGIKDITVFNKKRFFIDNYDRAYESANIADTKSTFFGLLPERIIEASCVSGIILIVLIRIHTGVDAAEFVPKMAVFAMGAFRLLPSISRLTGYVSMLIYSRPMLEATYENYISARDYISDEQEIANTDLDKDGRLFESELCIRGIEWKYPKGDSKILDNLSIVIKKGEAVGIIGESGTGKSTLADILLRLYKPQAGGIYMDGIDISTIPNTWSRVVSYVPQNVFLMDDTIRGNVMFGTEEADDERVWETLKRASLDEFVKGLPEGLDTIVGERGVKFSGGQRQRIAIARALFINPQILILDEATSALDNETEEAVMEAIDSLVGSVTLIIIAHRVTTLRNCDKIYEITNGRAVERDKKEVIKE
ncbi:MAG: ABC transporter ATP-binding protein [Lachnospiraceae bacterium]|nr:ABC transporter ATP-binding protein [Lachnospiraceae bacterium]